MKEQFIEKRFNNKSVEIINKANVIIREYQADGYSLTLRQIYYQFVARAMLPNTMKAYKRLGSIINDARLAGLIDWNAIEDRTRNLKKQPAWDNPSDIIKSCISQYKIDLWSNQPHRVEVWIEKEALVGVIERVCNKHNVPFFSCRGYSSQSEQWRAGKRLEQHVENGQEPIILHLGDHDPSGIDMTRDNQERLELLSGSPVQVNRLALNYDQVEEYDPPPNPTKMSDTRSKGYVENFGSACWELDALEPQVISNLVDTHISRLKDDDLWREAIKKQDADIVTLTKLSKQNT